MPKPKENKYNKAFQELLEQKFLAIKTEIDNLEFGKDDICLACLRNVEKIIKKHLR